MNYIKHLTSFFDRVEADDKLNPTHISLYISLFQYWNVNRFQNPISISRSEVMKISKICSKATYHKCMKQLHNYGYIRYKPSYNPFRGSLVHLMVFSDVKTNQKKQFKKRTGIEQVLNKSQTSSEQALVPSINSINIINNINEREKLPTLPEIENYFKEKKYDAGEAKKFYNHYKAIGWKIQGVTPIEDWQALAEKWMQNASRWNDNPTVSSLRSRFASSEAGREKQSPPAEINSLYQSFLEGKKIFKHITPDHFDELKLQLSDEILQHAKQTRINQLTGTNEASVIELLEAYLTNDPNNQLTQNDKTNLISLAKKIAVLNHFHSLKQSGAPP
jgi:hypothetical protein